MEDGDTVAKVLKRLLVRVETMYRSEGVPLEGAGGEQDVEMRGAGEMDGDGDGDDELGVDGLGDMDRFGEEVRDVEEEEQWVYEQKKMTTRTTKPRVKKMKMNSKASVNPTIPFRIGKQKRPRKSRKLPISDEIVASEDDTASTTSSFQIPYLILTTLSSRTPQPVLN